MNWSFLPSFSLLVAACVVLGLLGRLLVASDRTSKEDAKIWAALPIVGGPPTSRALNLLPFPWKTFAVLRSVTSTRSLVSRGYKLFNKPPFNRPFALPSIWTGDAVVVLPPSMLHVLNKPRDEFSSFEALLDTVRLRDLASDKSIWGNTFHFDVVRRDLTQGNMKLVAAPVADELDYAIRLGWGTNEKEWSTVGVWTTGVKIITRASLRIMVGDMCRDEELVEYSSRYAEAAIVESVMMNCLPPALRPIIGPLTSLRAKYLRRRCYEKLLPLVEERIRLWKEAKEGSDLPNDTLQWLIPKCANMGPEEVEPKKVLMRHLSLTTMFLFAITWPFVHTLLDVYTSPSAPEIISELRSECERVSKAHDGLRTAHAVDQLRHVDSALRESLRISDVMVHFLPLNVIGGEGMDLGNGIRIPAGSSIRTVFPSQAIHMDPDNYKDPERFDAFRFSRGSGPEESREDVDETREKGGRQQKQTTTGKGPLLAATITPTFLTFGYGRHPCPGRFILALMVKQALANVIMNYDIELVRKPGKRMAILSFMLPPVAAQIRVRRRA